METSKLIELLRSTQIWYNVVYIIIGIGSLITLPAYLISKYYYRPYGKSSAKEIIYEYYRFNRLIDIRARKLDPNNNKASDNIIRDEKGVVIAITNKNNIPLKQEEREQITKELNKYEKCAWQTYVAFEIEFKNKNYISNFNSVKGEKNINVYYDKYVAVHGEAIRSYLPCRLWKYIKTFLKRKKGNIYEYYFYGEYIKGINENIGE